MPEGEITTPEFNKAIQSARACINKFRFPIALVVSSFNGPFPFGAIRNDLLNSDATRILSDFHFQNQHYPYISVQDFDDGSRMTPQGRHIFDAVAEGTEGQRPLMMGGGYRPQPYAQYVETTRRSGKTPVSEERYNIFTQYISSDMNHRDAQARFHPLLPYVPEPNLFLDAFAVTDGNGPKFGQGGAEYTQLAKGPGVSGANWKGLGDYSAEEIVKLNISPEEKHMYLSTQRHPVRDTMFDVRFNEWSVETDLSRLVNTFDEKSQCPQTHNLPSTMDRMFAGKSQKSGISFKDANDGMHEMYGEQYFNALSILDDLNGVLSDSNLTEEQRQWALRGREALIGEISKVSELFGQNVYKMNELPQQPMNYTSPFSSETSSNLDPTKLGSNISHSCTSQSDVNHFAMNLFLKTKHYEVEKQVLRDQFKGKKSPIPPKKEKSSKPPKKEKVPKAVKCKDPKSSQTLTKRKRPNTSSTSSKRQRMDGQLMVQKENQLVGSMSQGGEIFTDWTGRYTIGFVSGVHNACLVRSLLGAMGRADMFETVYQALLWNGAILFGQMIDFYNPKVTQAIAATLGVRFQVHERNGNMHPIIGGAGPICHVFFENNHFSPMYSMRPQ